MLIEQTTCDQLALHLAKLLTDLPPLLKLVLGELPMTKVRRRDPRSTLLGFSTSAGPAMQPATSILFVGRTLTHGVPRRVFAPHRCPGQSGPKRHSIPMVTLSFVNMNNTPLMRCYYTAN